MKEFYLTAKGAGEKAGVGMFLKHPDRQRILKLMQHRPRKSWTREEIVRSFAGEFNREWSMTLTKAIKQMHSLGLISLGKEEVKPKPLQPQMDQRKVRISKPSVRITPKRPRLKR